MEEIKKFKNQKNFETDRLYIRPVKRSDAKEMFYNFWSSDAVYKYLPWEKCQDLNDAEQKIELLIQNNSIPYRYYWNIEKKGKGIVGLIWFVNYNELEKSIEAGYCLGEEFWGKGIMTEALTITSQYILQLDGINKICATHDLSNPASGKILQKSGYRKVKEEVSYSLSMKKDVLIGFYELIKEQVGKCG